LLAYLRHGCREAGRGAAAGTRHAKLALDDHTCNWRCHATHDALTERAPRGQRHRRCSPNTLRSPPPAATNLDAPIAFFSSRTDYSCVFSHCPGSRKAWWSLQTHFAFLPSAPIRHTTFHSLQPRWPRRALYMPSISHKQLHKIIRNVLLTWAPARGVQEVDGPPIFLHRVLNP